MPSQTPRINLIAAMSENRVIGRDGDLPWRLPADLQHFKKMTTGHAVLMGRKTFDSMGKPLPNRRNIVLTRDAHWTHPGVEVIHDPASAVAAADDADELFIIGGEQIYKLFLPFADRLYLTLVHAHVEGDTHFPQVDQSVWQLTDETQRPIDDRNEYAMTFQRYDRKP